jgi:hypothetical protein
LWPEGVHAAVGDAPLQRIEAKERKEEEKFWVAPLGHRACPRGHPTQTVCDRTVSNKNRIVWVTVLGRTGGDALRRNASKARTRGGKGTVTSPLHTHPHPLTNHLFVDHLLPWHNGSNHHLGMGNLKSQLVLTKKPQQNTSKILLYIMY